MRRERFKRIWNGNDRLIRRHCLVWRVGIEPIKATMDMDMVSMCGEKLWD